MRVNNFLAAMILGVVDPTCTLEKVCVSGYAASVRPSVSYVRRLKIEQMKEFDFPGDPSQYEEDHVIPLGLCGCARCPSNLWPQLWEEARAKDRLEVFLHKQVCSDSMPLREAQEAIQVDWKVSYKIYFGKAP